MLDFSPAASRLAGDEYAAVAYDLLPQNSATPLATDPAAQTLSLSGKADTAHATFTVAV